MTELIVQTAEVVIGDTIVSVSVGADWLTIDPDIHARVRAFVLDLRAMAAASSTTASETTSSVSSSGTDRTAPPASRKEGTGSRGPAVRLDCPFGCGKQYRRSSMYKHRATCPNRPDFTTPEFRCARCNKLFGKRNGLTIHEKTCKAQPQPIVNDPMSTECKFCGFPLKSIFERMQHEGTCPSAPPTLTAVSHPYDPTIEITGHQMLRCSQCGEAFAVDDVDELERHMWEAHSRAAKPHERRPRAAVS